ncbi:hypothetical protein ACOME3_002122 [Neoechinorhynchus agilis]
MVRIFGGHALNIEKNYGEIGSGEELYFSVFDYEEAGLDLTSPIRLVSDMSHNEAAAQEDRIEIDEVDSDENDVLLSKDETSDSQKKRIGDFKVIPLKNRRLNETSEDLEGRRIPKDARRTTPFMTTYERAKLLGTRATQISLNCPFMVELSGQTDPIQVALKELREGKIPLVIRRYLPNGSFEDWLPSELIVPE